MNDDASHSPIRTLEERLWLDSWSLNRDRRIVPTEPEDRLWFESLMADLSARFVRLPANLVDSAIEETQRVLCERLDLDCSSLWQRPGDDGDALLLTHLCQRGENLRLAESPQPVLPASGDAALPRETPPVIYRRMDLKQFFPWIHGKIGQGETIAISTPGDIPDEAALDRETFRQYGARSSVIVPLSVGGEQLGCLTFATTREERIWPEDLVRRFQLIAHLLANALARKRAEHKLRQSLAEIATLKDRLQAETDYPKVEGNLAEPCGAITGESEAIQKALHHVRQVASTDSTVLICGETGVGKELFAEAIHRLSPRKGHVLVKVNCAALPSPLVESELFGREKGAYTGALAQQKGRFDIADQSSVFLDEIGELSLEVQAKLLRVLQEGQFERLGSPKTIKVNVRLIAATNRDLAEEVRKSRFRQDLYYRLNVFPIKVPPLRERVEDIPLLVWTFVEELSARMGKKITKITRQTMDALQHHPWPGNVRELRNVIERSVIVSSGETLRVTQLQELRQTAQPLTLAENEREHILRVLEKTRWHIKGPSGAAGKLGLKPSTLYTRMQKLGIPTRRQKDGILTNGRHPVS